MPKFNFKIDEMMLVMIVAFVTMIVVVYDKINEPPNMEAEKITEMILDEHSISFVSNSIVNESKLKKIQDMSYDDFRKSLNAKNDFCVYIEDEKGNIILAKGSNKLSRDGIVCRE